MEIKARAIWEHGQLRLLDDLQMEEGQAVILSIQTLTPYEALKLALGQWAEFPDPNWGANHPIDEEAIQRQIDEAVRGLDLNMSKAIIEDREDRF